MPTKKNPRVLDDRWEQAGEELLRLDPDEYRRLLELGEAIIRWHRARPEAESREHQLLRTPRGELN